MSTKHRRPALYLLIIVLALTTALALFGTAMAISAARVADPRPAATETVVRAFYFAINEAIRTGDGLPLGGVVADDLIAHGSVEALAPGLAGLEQYLLGLHAISPDIEISVAQVAAAGDRAIAHLEVGGGAEDRFLGISLGAGRQPWGTIDALRVVGHRVVELWSGAPGLTLLEPLSQVSHDLPDTDQQIVVLDRLTVPPGGHVELPRGGERRLVYVAAGAVDSATQVFAGNDLAPNAWVLTEQQRPFVAGDFVALPDGSRTTMHNGGNAPAMLLVTSLSRPSVHARGPENRPDPDVATEDIGPDRTLDDGTLYQPFAGGIVTTLPAGRVTVEVGRMTLLPGAAMPSFEAGGPLLLAVEQGDLGVRADEQQAWVNRGNRGWSTSLDAGTLNPGDGVFVHAGTFLTLQNDSAEPVVALIVAIVPGDPVTT